MTGEETDRNDKPEPEVKPQRRRFSAEEKLRILAEADACTERRWMLAVAALSPPFVAHLITIRHSFLARS